MSSPEVHENGGKEFGPIFSRVYSFFSSRSRKSLRTYRAIAEDISRSDFRSILDVGCGPGILISMLSSGHTDAEIFGADPSRTMVSLASGRMRSEVDAGRVSIAEGNSMDIPFDGKFDMIVSSMSFHHWSNRIGSLEYLCSRLSPGGSLSIYERNRDDGGSYSEGKMYHSLSKDEAETLNVEGFRRSVKVIEDLIVVSFNAPSPG